MRGEQIPAPRDRAGRGLLQVVNKGEDQRKSESCGLHYVATGERFLREAVRSLESAKAVMPGIRSALCTNQTDHPLCAHFDHVYPVATTAGNTQDVILPLLDTPFEKTLHLDTDTYVCTDCRDVFEALNYGDLALVHDPWRWDLAIEEMPQSLPIFNGGVIAYRKTPEVIDTFREWTRIYQEKFVGRTTQNQPALREAVYRGKARLIVLPPEYNLRTYHPVAIGGYGKVRILHERRDDLPLLGKLLNRAERPRTFGRISLLLTGYYYCAKIRMVLMRWLKLR